MAIHHGIWECTEDEDQEVPTHAELTYDGVAASGPPSRPLDFPSPTVYRCINTEIRARNHRSGTVYQLRNVIIRSELDSLRSRPNKAYLVKKKLSKSTYGSLHLCIVLNRISASKRDATEQRKDALFDSDFVEWESTEELVVLKASEWSKIHAMRGRHLEDPIKEISAMQLLGNYHPHVQGAIEVLQDDSYLYTVMSYLPGGDLYGRLMQYDDVSALDTDEGNTNKGFFGFKESQARIWFRQLIMAVFHLQKKGVCHRDISLENLLFDEKDKLVLIDPGMSLRVPYADPCNYGCVADASMGGSRLLMKNQGQGGKLKYAAPEVLSKQDIVDAFAIDLWSVGVVLFVMLVGLAPFEWAHPTDQRYQSIAQGGLKDLMVMLDIPLSPEACDLLQGFFHSDPRRRLTLAEIMSHPWVQGKQFVNTPVNENAVKLPKKFPFSLEIRRPETQSPRPETQSPRASKKQAKKVEVEHRRLPSGKSVMNSPY